MFLIQIITYFYFIQILGSNVYIFAEEKVVNLAIFSKQTAEKSSMTIHKFRNMFFYKNLLIIKKRLRFILKRFIVENKKLLSV